MTEKLKNNEFIFDQKAIKYLADIVDKSNLTEVEYKCGDISIKFAKQVNIVHAAPQMIAAQPMHMTQPTPIAHQAAEATPVSTERFITAPVVGKVYHAAKPGDAPFVKVGDTIKEGQVIFIIEAMKVMNNVKADKSGVVKAILVEDAKPVEFGQKLLSLE